MKRAGAACIVIVAILCAATLDAQRLAPAFLTSSTTSTVFHRPSPTSSVLPKARDYRWEGLALGAALLGASAAYLGSRLCGLSDTGNTHCFATTVRLGLLGAFGGGIIGGVIGGMIPKAPETPP
jgi:H+/Cl- antiporter ClcA